HWHGKTFRQFWTWFNTRCIEIVGAADAGELEELEGLLLEVRAAIEDGGYMRRTCCPANSKNGLPLPSPSTTVARVRPQAAPGRITASCPEASRVRFAYPGYAG